MAYYKETELYYVRQKIKDEYKLDYPYTPRNYPMYFYYPFGPNGRGGVGFVNKKDAEEAAKRLSKEDKDHNWEVFTYNKKNTPPYEKKVSGLVNGEYYEWVYDEVLVWVPRIVKVTVPEEYVDLDHVDVTKNILKADNLNVYTGAASGKATSATASTNSDKTFGLCSVGDLTAKSSTSESYSTAFEGVTATITNNAHLEAHGNTSAESLGYLGGGWKAVSGSSSEAEAGVGSEKSAQNVTVIIGETATLKAGSVDLIALNEGSAKSAIDGKKEFNLLANVSKTKQPTESWYKTLVTVGKGANVESTSGDVRILSVDSPQAESKVQSSAFSVAVNYNSTKGENVVHQLNNVDFVRDSKVTAKKNVVVQAYQTTRAFAETVYDGTGMILEGSNARAENTIDRIVRINVGENAALTATDGFMKLNSFSGVANGEAKETAGIDLSAMQDSIQTNAHVESGGFISLGNAKAYADVASTSEITVASLAKLTSKKNLTLEALSTSNNGSYTATGTGMEKESFTSEAGVKTTASVDSSAGIPLPNAVAKSTLNYNTFVNINKGGEPVSDTSGKYFSSQEEMKRYKDALAQGIDLYAKKTTLTSQEGVLRVKASNDRLYVYNYADSLGKGAAGSSNGTAWIAATLSNAVWIDAADLTGKTGIDIMADNGGMPKGDKGDMTTWQKNSKKKIEEDRRVKLEAIGKSKLKGIGKAKVTARISGTQINQIRSSNVKNVTFTSNGYVTHVASDPTSAVKSVVKANASVPKLGPIKLGKTVKKKETEWYYFNRCDFCGVGKEYDVKPTEQEDPEERYKDADENAKKPIENVQKEVNEHTYFDNITSSSTSASSTASVAGYAKELVPIGDINRTTGATSSSTRARYGEEEYLQAGSVFVLDVRSILKKDVRMDANRIIPYRLWTNSETFHTVYLLPNATELYVGAGGQIQFVTDVLRGDVFGDGRDHYIALYSALSPSAFANPVIPIGSTGKLDFSTGTVMIPSFADFELYLHEISAEWFTEQLETGFFRTLIADQEALNNCALAGDKLPDGKIVEGLTDGGEKDGWKIYWLGDTPESAADADQTLLYLLVNEETDEVDAFRTSVNMLNSGEEPVDVSVYIYRDARADALEEEKYNVFFFDTPEGEMSLVKLITKTMERGIMVMPRSLQIVLRAFPVKGSDMPAFSLSDCVLILTQLRGQTASALDGAYEAFYDTTTFESPYIIIEGISVGNPVITIKQDQPVWPEWTGSDSAETIDGTKYQLIDGVWSEESELLPEAV